MYIIVVWGGASPPLYIGAGLGGGCVPPQRKM